MGSRNPGENSPGNAEAVERVERGHLPLCGLVHDGRDRSATPETLGRIFHHCDDGWVDPAGGVRTLEAFYDGEDRRCPRQPPNRLVSGTASAVSLRCGGIVSTASRGALEH